MNSNLSGKVALVTGGSRGIGRAIALGLAQAGADIVIASRTFSNLEKVVGEISQIGRRGMAVAADVSSKDDIDNLVVKTLGEFGQIDILVNDAGINPVVSPVLDVQEELWDEIMAINLKGCFLMCQVAGRSMVERRAGNIINIASTQGLGPGPFGRAVYSISKAGIIMLTKVLAKEWGQYGIRVNAIAPGVTETDMSRRLILEDTEARSQYMQRSLLKRITQPEDIAGAAVFLASDASRCMTGQVTVIDAGETV